MRVVDAHKAVGGLVIALNLLVGLWGLWAWRQHAVATPLLAQLLAFSHTIVLLEAAFGLYLLAGGYRSGQGLHYVYGAIPAGAVLFGYSARTPDARRNLLQFAVIALAIAVLAGRAFMTGAPT
jgi:hypothetical protein